MRKFAWSSKMKINPLMKRIVILLGVLVSMTAAQIVFGQGTEGVITYETKINMHRRIPAERAEMKAMIPEFRTVKNQLFFKPSESIYKPVIEDEEEETSASGGGGGRRMMFRMQNSETYLDQNSSIVLVKQEFMGKEYLIEDSVKVAPWKFGTETKTILGYECKQAYYTDETQPNFKQEITAWYTDKLRPFLGPDRMNTLPGAVLAVDINNGERVTLAQKVELKELKKNDLKAPTSGTRITQAEFRKMMMEQMKKMQEQGGNRMIIR
jgi:GLPGLI family protein